MRMRHFSRAIKFTTLNVFIHTNDIRQLIPHLAKRGYTTLHFSDVTDNWLDKESEKQLFSAKWKLRVTDSPSSSIPAKNCVNTTNAANVFSNRLLYLAAQIPFHPHRSRRQTLRRQWSFDATTASDTRPNQNHPNSKNKGSQPFDLEATTYVQSHFPDNPGEISFYYPSPAKSPALDGWFFTSRFRDFGPYEDAIVSKGPSSHHSVLSPLINIGLLSPQKSSTKPCLFATNPSTASKVLSVRSLAGKIHPPSLPGHRHASAPPTSGNLTMPFLRVSTPPPPAYLPDAVISKTLRYAFNHHIQRLMVLGNYLLLLTGTNSWDYVYRWFMEMYIDAYDWVMVPNIYGMSQFSDGGLMCTKPYISGSNYLRKMSDFTPGPGKPLDRSYWQFIDQHRSFFFPTPAYLWWSDCSIAELPGNRGNRQQVIRQQKRGNRVSDPPIPRSSDSSDPSDPPIPTPTLRRRDRPPNPSNTGTFFKGNFVPWRKALWTQVNLTVIWRYGGYPCN